MTINELFIKQNFIQPIVFKNTDTKESLPQELRVKIMRMRIDMAKIRKQFDEDSQELITQLKSNPEFAALQEKERSPEEETAFQNLVQSMEADHMEFVNQRVSETVELNTKFTEEEYFSIMEINTEDVTINGTSMKNADFLEVLYTLFVTEE